MKKYKITVNGRSYDVVVEECQTEDSSIPSIPPPVIPPKIELSKEENKVAEVPPKPAIHLGASDTAVKAQMPGTVVAFNVSVGDKVSEGDIVLILEAMKMENEVMAPVSGIVKSIHVEKGSSVVEGDILIQIG